MGSSKSALDKDFDLLVIGETLVEFSCDGDVVGDEAFKKDVGGADIVVAASAARLGSRVQLISAVAQDPFHYFVRQRLAAQNIDISFLNTCEGYNGLYFTSSNRQESREYLIHHPGTASRHISPAFVKDDLVGNAKIVYASSELQSVSRQTRYAISKAFNFAQQNNTMVAYDPNLRLMRWSLDEARECLWSVLPLLDVIFLSAPEESKALFGYEHAFEVIGFLRDRNVNMAVVVKMGTGGCMVGYDGKIKHIPLPSTDGLKDFTSPILVGSAFNGAFLYWMAREDKDDPFEAAEFANEVALFKGIKGAGIDSLPTVNDMA